MTRPEIVCLCGSTRFPEAFARANREETLKGAIVLSVGFFGHVEGGCSDEQKAALDVLHLRKIELADRVHVLNVDGYIGTSTAREVAFAVMSCTRITFLDPAKGEAFLEANSHRLARLGVEAMGLVK